MKYRKKNHERPYLMAIYHITFILCPKKTDKVSIEDILNIFPIIYFNGISFTGTSVCIFFIKNPNVMKTITWNRLLTVIRHKFHVTHTYQNQSCST